MKKTSALFVALALAIHPALAHHGTASLGAAGLEGPGAPIETSSSGTLPAGSWLGYVKLDHARFKSFNDVRDAEEDYASFFLYGLGYGVKPWLSAYAFLPYTAKVTEDNSFNTAGFTDMSANLVLGFKYDEKLMLIPANESLDDLRDWHFTGYYGVTFPTGRDENTRDATGAIDPGKALSFGSNSYTFGTTATKQLTDRLTWTGEAAYTVFDDHVYGDGNRIQFGTESRLNAALSFRLLKLEARKSRLDANIEGNYLCIGRDETNGIGDLATGGDIFYAVPGIRAYFGQTSVGLGVKLPVSTSLNEENTQQGSEGREKERIIFTFSTLF